MEYAVAHGYLMATAKGHAEERARHYGHKTTGKPQDWAAALAAKSGARGAGTRSVAPADSPIAGVTIESLRSSIAEMRAAEYALAKARGAGHH